MFLKSAKFSALALILALALSSQAAMAKVEVLTGPTPIPGGDAVSATDITFKNSLCAVSFAVGTAAPWGVARGGVIDAAAVKADGQLDMDRLTLMDFLPHKWSEWASTDAVSTMVKQTDREATLESTRKWRDATIVSTFTMKDGDDKIYLKTVMTNTGDKDIIDDKDPAAPEIFSGYGLWAKAGALREPAGAEGVREGRKVMADIKSPGTKTTVAYEENWAISIYAPFATNSSYEGKDLYLKHVLKPGESKTFEGWMQILPSGDISKAWLAEAAAAGVKPGTLKGKVSGSSKDVVAQPAIVAERDGLIYTWGLGKDGSYEIALPAGDYDLYAAALNYSPSEKQKVTIKEGANADVNFEKLAAPGTLNLKVTDQKGKPIDGRLAIVKGVEQPIVFLGPNTLFTRLERHGELTVPLAPGAYTFSATHGDSVFAPAQEVSVEIAPEKPSDLAVKIDITPDPRAKGWYNADLHHHSNLLDADTPPEFLVRSQAAAGVDFIFISDHDTVANHEEIDKFAKLAGIAFIPGLEISPSWAHFNVYPLPLGKGIDADPSTATVTELFDAARKAGAKVIAVNHPTIEYGYFTARDNGTIPGGKWNGDFNLLELNATSKYEKDFELYWDFWNKGEKYYLSGGTDDHNVWRDKSASIREFVHVDGDVTIDKFIDGLLAGHAYVTRGPLVYPETMFGSTIPAGQPVTLNFDLESVMGLKKITLLGNGKEVEVKEFKGAPKTAQASFEIKKPEAGQWYSVVIEDAVETPNKAWSNPYWVN